MATTSGGNNAIQDTTVEYPEWNQAKHKIFLCHSGDDKAFVVHLNYHLARVHHYPFFDTESLPKGKQFPKRIFEAAKQCRLAIVVLSNKFFMSKWPMLELSAFIDAQQSTNSKLKILPLFYKITIPQFKDEVRRSCWFKKWDKIIATQPEGRIDKLKWEEALKVLDSTHGLELVKYGQHEVKYIDAVVDDVLKLVPVDVKYFDSSIQGKTQLCQKIRDMFHALKASTHDGPSILGIYGIGGSGKTTLCKMMCNNFFEEFAGRVCLVEMQSKSKSSIESQKIALQTLTNASEKLLREITDFDKGRSLYEQRIHAHKIFLALDNVSCDDSESLEEARSYLEANFKLGSKIMVTSRHVTSLHKLEIIKKESCFEMPESGEWTPKKKVIKVGQLHGLYNWDQVWKLPKPSQGILSFDILQGRDVHIGISPKCETTQPMYEIIIGGYASSIRRNAKGQTMHEVQWELQDCIETTLWVSIDASRKMIKIGQGEDMFLLYKDLDFVDNAQYISFTSSETPYTYSNVEVANITNLIGTNIVDLPLYNLRRNEICNETKGFMRISPMHSKYEWNQYWKLPNLGQGIISFEATGHNGVHIAIGPHCYTTTYMYEVIIGRSNNNDSWIRRQKGDKACVKTAVGLKNPGGGNKLWVSIDSTSQMIQAGRGSPGEDVICIHRDLQFISGAQYVCFSTWKSPIEYSNVIVTSIESNFEEILNNQLGLPNPQLKHGHHDFVEGKGYVELPRKNGIYSWDYYWLFPKLGHGVLFFDAHAHNDVHVAISTEPQTLDPMYEIVIGGWANTKSVIRRQSQGCIHMDSTPNGLQFPGEVNSLQVSIDATTQVIQVYQRVNGEDVHVCAYNDLNFLAKCQYISFTTWDSPITYTNIMVKTID